MCRAGRKKIWGDDADKWKPERWVGDEEGIKRLEDKVVVFSKGPRGCGGKEIAMPTMEKTVVGVLEKWDLTAKGSLMGAGLLEMQYAECDMSARHESMYHYAAPGRGLKYG
jgi:benzoate 4-monooxygenase